MTTEKTNKYTLEFYKLDFDPSVSSKDIFMKLYESDVDIKHDNEKRNYSHEIYDLNYFKNDDYYAGIFRKFRLNNIPEKGKPGYQSKEIELELGEGIVERNMFIFYPKRDLLVWCVDRHASTVNQFTTFLKQFAEIKVSSMPLVKTDTIKRLMRPAGNLLKFSVAIPRSSVSTFPCDPSDFSSQMLNLLNMSNGDKINLDITIDPKLPGSKGSLLGSLKKALINCSENGATRAKATVIENGTEQVIDLFLDRIKTQIELESNAKYPPAFTMYRKMHDATLTFEDELREYDKE